jgi:hypothetical protein
MIFSTVPGIVTLGFSVIGWPFGEDIYPLTTNPRGSNEMRY